MVGDTAGWTDVYSEASAPNYAVARLSIGSDYLRCRFEKTSNSGILHEFTMARE